MNIFSLDKTACVNYARRWAFDRNPAFYNFDKIGGDCTSFISQCIYNGCFTMNYTPTFGWYYNSVNDRAPAWSGVNELYRFITSNKSYGPFGELSSYYQMGIGDVIQLFNGTRYYHTLLVTDLRNEELFTSSHTADSFNRPFSSYNFVSARFIKLLGYRK